jgi:hypothetical protein
MSEPLRLEHGDAEVDEDSDRDGNKDALHYIHESKLPEQEKRSAWGRYAMITEPFGSLTNFKRSAPHPKRLPNSERPEVPATGEALAAPVHLEGFSGRVDLAPLRQESLPSRKLFVIDISGKSHFSR